MAKRDDIEQRDWDAAEAVGEAVYGRHERGWVRWPLFDGHNLRVSIARAIATARDEGRAEGRQARQLLPCKRCNSLDYEVFCPGGEWAVECQDCGYITTPRYSTFEEAAQRWNMHPTSAAIRKGEP